VKIIINALQNYLSLNNFEECSNLSIRGIMQMLYKMKDSISQFSFTFHLRTVMPSKRGVYSNNNRLLRSSATGEISKVEIYTVHFSV